MHEIMNNSFDFFLVVLENKCLFNIKNYVLLFLYIKQIIAITTDNKVIWLII